MNLCFICGKYLRGLTPLDFLCFWRDKVIFVKIQTATFGGIFPMCKIHGESASINPHVTEALVHARVRAMYHQHEEDN